MRLIEVHAMSKNITSTSLDLLSKAIFGNSSPELFDKTKNYAKGDKVYIRDENGDLIIKECMVPGTHPNADDPTIWKTVSSNSLVGGGTPAGVSSSCAEFVEGGNYTEGNIVYVTTDSGVKFYECVKDGKYTTVDPTGFKQVDANVDADTMNSILQSVFGVGKVPPAFEPGQLYEVGDVVYTTDSNGNIVVKECVIADAYNDTNSEGWVVRDISDQLATTQIEFATDDDIDEMFINNVPINPGESIIPPTVVDQNLLRDLNNDGNVDTDWISF